MLVRVLVAYTAWLTMILADIPASISVFIVIAAPMFFGSVVRMMILEHSILLPALRARGQAAVARLRS